MTLTTYIGLGLLFLMIGCIIALLKKSKKYALIFSLSFLGIIVLMIAFLAVHISYNDGQM